PGALGVHVTKQRVVPVLRVPEAVVRQGGTRLVSDVMANSALVCSALVNVVAKVEDEIQIVLGHVMIGREMTFFIVLARGECKPQPGGQNTRLGHRARTADRAYRVPAMKPIPVPSVGL